MKVPFISLEDTNSLIRKEIYSGFEDFFEAKQYVLGSLLQTFEKAYSNYCESRYCIGVSNGLDALFLSLAALEIGKGDEVIIPSHTFIATALAILYTGAKPILVEPKISSFNIGPDLIEEKITTKTKAIIPVHLYGQACEMTDIIQIARKHNLYVVEDNAQAQGALWNGRKTGSFGHINATSFYPIKNLGALGDAGAITTNDSKFDGKLRQLRNYGSIRKYHHEMIGYNKRLDEVQATFLNIKLKYLDIWNLEREGIAQQYLEELKNIGDIVLPRVIPGATSVWHLFVIRTKYRDQLQSYLKSKGIDTLIHYPIPVHLQESFRFLNYKKGDFPIAEQISESCLSLPIYPGLRREQIHYICSSIRSFYGQV